MATVLLTVVLVAIEHALGSLATFCVTLLLGVAWLAGQVPDSATFAPLDDLKAAAGFVREFAVEAVLATIDSLAAS